jgi:triosephosphate isomerase (TIM)
MTRPVFVGVSLKAYFGHTQARDWNSAVAEFARATPAIARGDVTLFVIPSYLGVLPALEAYAGTGVLVGAQDVAAEEPGPFTGEVTAAELAEVGVAVAEIGHAERRRLYGETDEVVAAKTAAALRHGLAPVLCLGETERGDAAAATATVVAQLRSGLDHAPAGRVVVAYEPVWAIGAPEPASPDHVIPVAAGLRAALDALPGRDASAVVYGGSAGPGLLTALGDAVDGLFLGRFAHDPAALAAVLVEASELAARRTA